MLALQHDAKLRWRAEGLGITKPSGPYLRPLVRHEIGNLVNRVRDRVVKYPTRQTMDPVVGFGRHDFAKRPIQVVSLNRIDMDDPAELAGSIQPAAFLP